MIGVGLASGLGSGDCVSCSIVEGLGLGVRVGEGVGVRLSVGLEVGLGVMFGEGISEGVVNRFRMIVGAGVCAGEGDGLAGDGSLPVAKEVMDVLLMKKMSRPPAKTTAFA